MTTVTTTDGRSPIFAWLLHGHEEATRCGCTARCGRHQTRPLRGVDHPGRPRLAPIDLSSPIEPAPSLTPPELMFWCHNCRDTAEAVERRRQRTAAQPDLRSAA